MSKKSYIIYIILLILVVFGIGIMVYARFRTPSFEAAEQSEFFFHNLYRTFQRHDPV